MIASKEIGNQGAFMRVVSRISVVLGIVLCALGTSAYPTVAKTGFVLGVGVHLWGSDRPAVDRTLSLVSDGGFQMIRWDAPWKAVEKEKGVLRIPAGWDYTVDSAAKHGIGSLLILDYGNSLYDNGDKPRSPEAIAAYTQYALAVVQHFKDRVHYFQIWNEWNGTLGDTSRGSGADYASLIKTVYPALKQAAPDAKFIIGGFSTTSYNSIIGVGRRDRQFEDFLDQPDIAKYGDVIALHPYVVYRDGPIHTLDGYEYFLNAVIQRVRSTPGLKTKPIFITEIGWSTAASNPKGVNDVTQGNYLSGAVEYAKSLGVSGVFVYELTDGSTDPNDMEGNFGVFTNGGNPKPAVADLKAHIQ